MANQSIDELRANARALLDKVREERDELRVQMHLARADG